MEKRSSSRRMRKEPEGRKRKYVSPSLLLVSFSSEAGFATSVGGDASHYDDPGTTPGSENKYQIGEGVWDI